MTRFDFELHSGNHRVTLTVEAGYVPGAPQTRDEPGYPSHLQSGSAWDPMTCAYDGFTLGKQERQRRLWAFETIYALFPVAMTEACEEQQL